jgi:subtilisin-like proprotein convertase family protein
MPATSYNFVIEQGSDFKVSFQYLDEAGNNIDLTNWCVVLQWKTNNDDVYVFSNRNNTTNYSLTADATGRIVLQIPSRTTLLYDFDSAVYDLDLQETTEQYFNSGLRTYRLVTGGVGIVKRNLPINIQACSSFQDNSNTLEESCNIICNQSDIYSVSYSGDYLGILDNTTVSGVVNVNDPRTIENVEVIIEGLTHSSPQDLSFLLAPPSGNKILLSANNKIGNYRDNFTFGFSNRAPVGSYLNSINNGGICNILDKTNIVKYNNETLTGSINHLINYSVNGNWALIVRDSDIGGSGSINSWKLIITYNQ